MSNEILDSPIVDTPIHFRFEAEMGEPKKLIPMLNAIDIMKTCVLTVTCRGLKFSCQDPGKCLQANSFIDRTVFKNFFMSEEVIPVSVSFRLPDLMSVLSYLGFGDEPTDGEAGLLSGDDPSLTLSYDTNENKLCLTVNEDNGVTTAMVGTFDTSEHHILFPSNFCNKVIVNAEPFVVFWKCCDLSSEFIQVSITRREPYLQWTTESERARVDQNIHRDSHDVEQFLCTHDVSNKYKTSLMKTSIKGLIRATKLSIRTNRDGLLSLQFILKAEQNMNDNCFVEYFVVPEADAHSYQS